MLSCLRLIDSHVARVPQSYTAAVRWIEVSKRQQSSVILILGGLGESTYTIIGPCHSLVPRQWDGGDPYNRALRDFRKPPQFVNPQRTSQGQP